LIEQRPVISSTYICSRGISLKKLCLLAPPRSMLATLARFRDAELPISDEQIVALRTFFTDWRTALSG
jgi:hypothetical protein